MKTNMIGLDLAKSVFRFTPRQNNSAFTRRSGGISKQGQRDIRCLLILGASSHLRQEKARRRMKAPTSPWLTGLLARRPVKVAAVAQAASASSSRPRARWHDWNPISEPPQGQRLWNRTQRPDT